MESPLKQRLIGAAVLAALAIIFLPMLLKGPDVKEPDAAEVPLSMPATPGESFETRELPLTAPEATAGEGGVLGMKPGAEPVATDATGEPDTAPAESMPAGAAAVAPADAKPPLASEPVVAPPAATPPAAAKPAAPAAAAPAASVGPGAAAGATVLSVGTFANAASATALAARLRAAGLPVLSERVEIASGVATRLRVGPFASRAAAEAARQRVEQISSTPSKAVVLDAAPPPPGAAPAKTPAAAAATQPAIKPASKPATTASTPAKPAASSGFAVQLSAPSVEADANALRDRARAAGFAAYVQRVDTASGARYRVRLGPVADRAGAESLQAEARAKLGNAGIIVSSP